MNTSPVHLEVKEGAKPKHHKYFPSLKVHKINLKKTTYMTKKYGDSTYASPTLIIPKENGSIRNISDFNYLNKNLVRKLYPIPKISNTPQKLEGNSYTIALDIDIGN